MSLLTVFSKLSPAKSTSSSRKASHPMLRHFYCGKGSGNKQPQLIRHSCTDRMRAGELKEIEVD